MPDFVHLPSTAFRRTPWKNGGGVTIDIADSYRPGAEPGGWTGMIWRFGRTSIVTPAPFSDLTGNDRILTVVVGRGLRLHAPDGHVIDAREPFHPVRFPGELPLTSELEDGPVEVLNLMADRSAVAIDVRIVDRPQRVSVGPGDVVFYAVSGEVSAVLDGVTVHIPAGDAVQARVDREWSCDHRTGIMAIASATARSSPGG